MKRLLAWFNAKRYKVIYSNVAGINRRDDRSYPYKLDVMLRPPEFCGVMFAISFGGCEEVTIRANRLGYLKRYMRRNGVRNHPRLIEYCLRGPDGVIERSQNEHFYPSVDTREKVA